MNALPASFIVVLLGCGPAAQSASKDLPRAGTVLITAEQIEKWGAQTAWQALKRGAPMLTLQEDRSGRPRSMGRRGRSSFVLDEAPIILLDGVRVPDFHALDTIEGQSILSILIYDGVEGTTYYGTDAVSGVIAIKTKDGHQS